MQTWSIIHIYDKIYHPIAKNHANRPNSHKSNMILVGSNMHNDQDIMDMKRKFWYASKFLKHLIKELVPKSRSCSTEILNKYK